MTKTLIIPFNLSVAMQETWNRIYMDAGSVTSLEAAELTLDRLEGAAGKEVDALIAKHGYDTVLSATARVI